MTVSDKELDDIGYIEDPKEYGPFEDPGTKTENSENGNLTRDQFEQELIKKYHFKSLKDTEEIYYYDSNKGIYIKNAEWLIKQECIKYNPQTKTNDVNDTKNRIIWANYVDRSEFDPDIEWLACRNVMINLRTGEVKEHSPDFMATVQIPHKYNLLYKTPHIPTPQKILKFLHEVMASYEDVEMFLDFLAYCLWRDLQFHKFLLCNGSGRNGKGVTTELVTKFLGYDNVSNETLERILNNNTCKIFGQSSSK